MTVVSTAVVAVLAWIGWFALAPAIGFPEISPAAVINTAITDTADPRAATGWIVVVVGLIIAAAAYVFAAGSLVPRGIASGLLYGALLWLVVGAIIMPLLGLLSGPEFSSAMSSAPMMTPMEPTFMMAGRGFLAPIEALIGWLTFGAILGASKRSSAGEAAQGGGSRTLVGATAAAVVVTLLATAFIAPAGAESFEVWAIDLVGTGVLYIYPGADLIEGTAQPEIVDLRKAASSVGDGPGEQPHMIDFNPHRSHALIANTASGHIYVMRVSDREIVASLDVGDEAHDVTPSPDGRIALVSKRGDKKLGVIRTDYESETFTYDPEDDLDLGARERKGFPDNQPICALFPRDDRIAYVTMKGGGLYVVDAAEERPRIIKAFPDHRVKASGCGAAAKDGRLYLGWGTESLSRFYVLDHTDHSLVRSLPVDAHGADAHGLTFVGDGRYIWMAMRGADSILIVDTKSDQVAGSIGGFGLLPDMPIVSPTGTHVFLTLRGRAFFPVEEDPRHQHEPEYLAPPRVVERTSPGIVVFEVLEGGASGRRSAFIPMPPGPSGEPADPHAVALIPKEI